jgi:hypothetical protein
MLCVALQCCPGNNFGHRKLGDWYHDAAANYPLAMASTAVHIHALPVVLNERPLAPDPGALLIDRRRWATEPVSLQALGVALARSGAALSFLCGVRPR